MLILSKAVRSVGRQLTDGPREHEINVTFCVVKGDTGGIQYLEACIQQSSPTANIANEQMDVLTQSAVEIKEDFRNRPGGRADAAGEITCRVNFMAYRDVLWKA